MVEDIRSRAQLRRAVLSSYLGSVIEYYDFLLYATAAAVVFTKVFFSGLDPVVGTVASLGTFTTGYLARPLGGVLFGHFGDLLGRKRMLILTMTLMGLASTLIGVLPTYAAIGVWAPVLLIVLRVLQGIAVGGEWGGAVLMSAEHATSRRGLWASFTGAGAPSGMIVSTLLLTLMGAVTTDEQFLAWGWRVPFLLSVVLLAIGLFVRLKVDETPVFRASHRPPGAPLLEVLRRYPRNLLLGIGVGFGAFIAQGTLTTYLLSYAVQAGFSRQTVLNAITISSAGAVLGVLGYSALSDRVGRRPVVIGGALAMGVVAFLLFPLIDSGSVVLLTLAVVLGQSVAHPAMYGPLAALYTELFGTRTRYTGASLGYQVAGIGAGVAPVVFAAVAGAGTLVISVVIAACCLVTVLCVLALGESSRADLADPAPVRAVGVRR
ncbi:MFS family permease [Amycolatopsis bartoniae]|uniref:Putative proline/betaine transporter n=1 Tax=Amycolatopsis bartoniae TaxID=941986 RepID=A0A8H9M3R1_9PSEU|nr:MFS transporter [Amycolatopsis bartoniae]MBB2937802.1 MFS family permease [Amycolatopsis bartoniae]TVT06531.1 MHS family MFS transporter [Amycolatopsis bartoniae]GHF40812.1 MFS transporter [Amycolatopsis bartoniae]